MVLTPIGKQGIEWWHRFISTITCMSFIVLSLEVWWEAVWYISFGQCPWRSTKTSSEAVIHSCRWQCGVVASGSEVFGFLCLWGNSTRLNRWPPFWRLGFNILALSRRTSLRGTVFCLSNLFTTGTCFSFEFVLLQKRCQGTWLVFTTERAT